MPLIDFSNVSDVADFSPIPDGEYLCRLTDVGLDRTKNGDEMWKLRWRVEGGEFDGRMLFDNMVFSENTKSRVKLLCSCCGVDVSGQVDVQPTLLLDKLVMVTTYQEEYLDQNEQPKVSNKIPFDGYCLLPDAGSNAPF